MREVYIPGWLLVLCGLGRGLAGMYMYVYIHVYTVLVRTSLVCCCMHAGPCTQNRLSEVVQLEVALKKTPHHYKMLRLGYNCT